MNGSKVGEGVGIVFRVEDIKEEAMKEKKKKKFKRELQMALIPCKDNNYMI